MILVDTNVLIALVDPRDSLHARACADLKRLVRKPLGVTIPVLTEAAFALPARHHRARLRAILQEFRVRVIDGSAVDVEEIFVWLDDYHDHDPDWADAHLAVLSGHQSTWRIWTYDTEFTTVWRRPDGTRIPLAPRQ